MEPNIKEFKLPKPLPERIREGRIARALSTEELAALVDVSRSAIAQFERGLSSPSSSTMAKISNALNLPISFFIDPLDQTSASSNGATYFRSMKSAKKKVKETIKTRAQWVETKICSYLEKYLEFPPVSFSDLIEQIDCQHLDEEEIELIAEKLRFKFGIGNGPISDLTLLLEKQGVIISKVDFGDLSADACSQWRGNRPYVFLGNNKSAVRSRLDLAHELGHLVLHAWVGQEQVDDKKVLATLEDQANYFAGAFLLPRDTFLTELTSISLDHFVSLKKRWKVSISAMIIRCYQLGVLTDNQYRYLNTQLNINKWKKKEPLDNEIPHEVPRAFHQAINLLVEHGVQTPSQIAEQIRLYPDEIEAYCSLAKGTLSATEESNVIQFGIRNNESKVGKRA